MNEHGGHQMSDQALWHAIRNRTRAIGFEGYRSFVNRVLGTEERGIHAFELIPFGYRGLPADELWGQAWSTEPRDTPLIQSRVGIHSSRSNSSRRNWGEYFRPSAPLEHIAHVI